jgi:Transposase DDE domain
MFIKLTRSGPRTYLQIVEAYRDPATGRPKQRHLATLGRLEHLQEKDLQGLLKGLQQVLGPETRGVASGGWTASELSFEPALEVGPAWVLTQLWEQVGLSEVLVRCFADRRRAWAVEPLIRVMVLNRLGEPSSKLGVLSWLERVYLPGVERAGVTHQRLLRAMDVLLKHQAAVEAHLLRWLPAPVSVEVVFYDITTVRIHGEGEGGEEDLRCYGHSKDVQGVDRQFAVGVVQTADGFPVAHQVFRGNIGESTTVQGVVRGLCERFRIRRLIFIADRGMLSVDNLEELEAITLADGRAVEYLVAVPVRRYQRFGNAVVALHPALLAASRARRGEVVRETTTTEGRRLVVAHSPAIAKRSRRLRAKRLRQVLQLARALEHQLEAQDRGEPRRGRKLTDTGAKV